MKTGTTSGKINVQQFSDIALSDDCNFGVNITCARISTKGWENLSILSLLRFIQPIAQQPRLFLHAESDEWQRFVLHKG